PFVLYLSRYLAGKSSWVVDRVARLNLSRPEPGLTPGERVLWKPASCSLVATHGGPGGGGGGDEKGGSAERAPHGEPDDRARPVAAARSARPGRAPVALELGAPPDRPRHRAPGPGRVRVRRGLRPPMPRSPHRSVCR